MQGHKFSTRLLKSRILRVLVGAFTALILFAFVLLRHNEDGHSNNLTPVWHGITPGKTTEWELRAILGNPKAIKICPYWPGWVDPYRSGSLRDLLRCLASTWAYTYEEERVPGKAPAKHEIRLRFATVVSIVESEWLSPSNSSPLLLKKSVRDYGQPETVTWATQFPYYRAFLFCEHGTIVFANDIDVGQIIYFASMPVSTCVREFEYDISIDDPFAGAGSPSPENPWPWLINEK